MSLLSENLGVMVVALETTYKTDAVNAAFDANTDFSYFRVNSAADMTPVATNVIPGRMRPGQGGVGSSFVKSHGDITIPCPLGAGVGANFTPTNLAVMMQASGWEMSTGGSATTFTLGTENTNSASAHLYRRDLIKESAAAAWRLKRGVGAMFNFGLEGSAGQEVLCTFQGQCANYPEWTVSRNYFNASDEPALDWEGNAITYTGTASAESDERFICKSSDIQYNSGALVVKDWSFDSAMAIGPLMAQTGDPQATRITRTRGDGANASGSVTVLLSDNDAGYTDILAAIEAEEVANLVIVIEGSTTKYTLTARIQFQARPTETAEAGTTAFTANFIGVDDLSAAPFGDNGATLVVESV